MSDTLIIKCDKCGKKDTKYEYIKCKKKYLIYCNDCSKKRYDQMKEMNKCYDIITKIDNMIKW